MVKMEDLDAGKVFFVCNICGYVFQEDPFKMPVRCPQCGSEDVSRT
nr:hypothetical protein [Methanophagales archaeon]